MLNLSLFCLPEPLVEPDHKLVVVLLCMHKLDLHEVLDLQCPKLFQSNLEELGNRGLL